MITRLAVIILAAGEGKRLLSSTPKPFQSVAGLPLIAHVLATTKSLQAAATAVVLQEKYISSFWNLFSHLPPDPSVITALQEEPLGTAHAAMSAWETLNDLHTFSPFSHLLILPADTPLISHASLDALIDFHLHHNHTLSIIGFYPQSPQNYGRIISHNAQLLAIREEKDCSPEEKLIPFCNGGITLINTPFFEHAFPLISPKNNQKELYLTDLVQIASEQKYSCGALPAPHDYELLGINTRSDLALVEKTWQERQKHHLMNSVGVSLPHPESVILHHDTIIKQHASIGPFTVFGKGVVIEEHAVVEPFSHLEGVTVKSHAKVGPFARIRPQSFVESHAKVGTFVEVKNSRIGPHAKASHLAYIGDANLEEYVNIGAGTVVANYDGHQKFHTTIKEHAFIGSNSTLVSPLTIGAHAFATAGSVIVHDIPHNQRAFARARQVLKPPRKPKEPSS
jgi:bifunctional UDP-N-acetylglucosamine pyrophosphorylase/glucosamine-1-phosphate N-acetyltransferase